MEHDLFRKALHTFRDHALAAMIMCTTKQAVDPDAAASDPVKGAVSFMLSSVLTGAAAIAAGLYLVVFASGSARAQTPPSAAEVAGYTGLHGAAHRGDAIEIIRLLREGLDPNGRDAEGRTPLHVAVFGSHADAVRALVRGGADPNALEGQRYDIVTIAAVQDDAAMVGLALALGGSARNITSPYDGTALIAAAHLGHIDVVRELIQGGAPLDHVNNLGWTALLETVILGNGGRRHTQTVRALTQAGADARIADRQGATPLAHARRRGYQEMIDILQAAVAK
jgi:ankyrin repeat protein